MANFELDGLDTQDYDTWRQAFIHGSQDWAKGELPWTLNERKFFPYACTFCHRGTFVATNLSRCTKCKMAFYCSRECQKRHFKRHKPFCKVISKFTEMYPALEQGSKNNEFWLAYKQTSFGFIAEFAKSLGPECEACLRDPTNSDSWFLQRHCQVCFFNPSRDESSKSEAEGDEPPRKLVECPKCPMAACCNRESCQKKFESIHTAQSCECALINVAILVMSLQQGTVLAIPSDSSLTSVTQTRDINDWVSYLKYKSQDFKDNLDPRMLKLPPVVALLTNCLSTMLTIVHGIKICIPDYESRDTFTIHIVGAEYEELRNLPRYEEILHMMPWVKRVHLIFVGPADFLKDLDVETISTIAVGCMDCQANRKLTCDIIHGLYHDITESSSFRKPDIVLASNSGLHECGNVRNENLNASWKDTAKLLAKMNVPVIYTAYTESEGEEDQKCLRKDWGIKILVQCTRNPFRSLSPCADEQYDNIYYYNNNYIIMASGFN